MASQWELRKFSTDALLEEMIRRANNQPIKKPEDWCHDCMHFEAWLDKVPSPRADCQETYNPCTKGHTMRFMVPEELDEEHGFYRRVCADRLGEKNRGGA